MAASGEDQLQLAIDQQAQVVAAAENALARAERAVAQARTPSAATEAHRRADAALIELELAETELLHRTRQATLPAATTSTQPRPRRPPLEQAPLFDVG